MAQRYFYFGNIPFAYDDTWGTLISSNKGKVFEIRIENSATFLKMLSRINAFAELNKEVLLFALAKDGCVISEWASSLSLCLKVFHLTREEHTDGSFTITHSTVLFIKCDNKLFKLIILYEDYLEIANSYNVAPNNNDEIEIDYPFNESLILDNGSLKLTEDLVHDGDSFKVYLKKGDEHIHNRPHVQCKMDGEMYNISIDSKIEYLGKTSKKQKNINFLVKEIQKPGILQKARELWNSIPSNYKFIRDNNGNLITPS